MEFKDSSSIPHAPCPLALSEAEGMPNAQCPMPHAPCPMPYT
ncbi:hypothetical protein [Nostoc sp. CHAB 5715]|nr:hypothetical protein [Nostoc sp. CHAB 5715]